MPNPPHEWPYGSQQSPIHIYEKSAISTVFPLDYLAVEYDDELLTGHFNCETHNFIFDKQPQLQFNGGKAHLERIHIHSRSEHRIDGKDFDFEMHFVNPLECKSDDSWFVVLAAFFKEVRDAKTPPSIQALNEAIKNKPSDGQCPKVAAPINPVEFLPKNRSQFFRYEGSLTTPDDRGIFKERVSWVVYPHLVEVNPDHVVELKKYAKEESRLLQDYNRRFVLKNFA